MAQSPVLAFDTHAAVVELTEAGMPERQAESVVRLQSRLIEQHFATRADIEQVNSTIESSRLATEAQFESSRQATNAQFESSRQATNAQFVSSRQAADARFEAERRATDAQFEASRLSTEATIASLKAELIKWMIGTNLAFATLVIAAIGIL